MRITGNRLIEQTAANTQQAQVRYGNAAEVVSSGLRVDKPSDDPAAWLAAHRARLQQNIVAGTGKALQYGRERLAQTDGALSTLSQIVESVRALAIQGTNDTYDAVARGDLGMQVQGLFDAARAAANTQAPDGEFLLAGSAATTQPFDNTGAYTGDTAVRVVPDAQGIGVTHASSLAGSELTAASGPNRVDILPLLQTVATALKNNDTATLQSAIGSMATAVSQMSDLRTRTGGLMTAIDTVSKAHDLLATTLQESAASLVEADTTTAAGELAKASTALDVSRTVSGHVIQTLSQALST